MGLYAFGSYRTQPRFERPFYRAPGQPSQWTEAQRLYYRDNPAAAVEAMLGLIPQTGAGAASRDYLKFARQLLTDRTKAYTGAAAADPNLSIEDYLGDVNLGQEYALSNPYARPFTRRTRTIRSY